MQIQKQVGKPPIEIARTILAHLPMTDFVSKVDAVPPGFLNFHLADPWLTRQVDNIIAAGDRGFQQSTGGGKTAQGEYGSANPTWPLGGHRIPGGAIGDTTAKLLQTAGCTVSRANYFNNA